VDIKDFIPLVRIIAQNIHRSLPANIMQDDLVQDGMVGLIMAFRQHKADADIPFKTFAGNKIKWAIMDGLRAGDWADKHVRGRANKVSKTIEKLQAILHRDPSKVEIANALGVRAGDIATILGDAYGYNFVRVDESIQVETQDDGVQGDIQGIPDLRMEPSAIVERRELYSRAIAGLQTLQPNERKAFILRNMCDMSGRQAAAEMNLSESRVSQLFKSATEKLANYV
jgi:RNA polymerase sigma factor for flagellar operon FliA